MAALPRLLPLLLLLLAASSAALLAINAHSSCPGPLAIPCIPRSYSCHFRSALWACESAHPHAAPGAPAPADGAGPTPRLGVPLPQRGIGRREPERRGPSGLPGRTLAAHTPAEHPETRLASSSPQSLGQPQALSPIPLHTASLSRTACPPSAIRRYRRLRRQGSPWSVRIQREIGRREPERRGPSGLPGRTLAAHTPAERPRNAPGLQISAEQRVTSNPTRTLVDLGAAPYNRSRLYQLLEGENKKKELFITHGNLEEVAEKLKQDVSLVQEQLAVSAQEHSFFLSKLNSDVNLLCEALYQGGNQLLLSDQELTEQFHQVESQLNKLNHLLTDIFADVKTKRKLLASNKLHQVERELYVYFLKDEDYLKNIVENLENQSKIKTIGLED